jgi:hypothetical protein
MTLSSLPRLALVVLLAPCLPALADPWADHDAWLKGAIADCRAAGRDRTACRHFTGEALQKLFGIEDFCRPSRCLKAVEIEWELRNGPDKWTLIGTAADSAALHKARELAALGKAVLAVQNERDRGQVAILMPGPPVPAGRWKLDVPIVVAARVDRPERSVYGKGLNWVFDEAAQVRLYTRR